MKCRSAYLRASHTCLRRRTHVQAIEVLLLRPVLHLPGGTGHKDHGLGGCLLSERVCWVQGWHHAVPSLQQPLIPCAVQLQHQKAEA